MSTAYRIDIEGRLPAGAAEELAATAVDWDGSVTTVRGVLADAAALYGFIARLEALGLTVVAITSGSHTTTHTMTHTTKEDRWSSP